MSKTYHPQFNFDEFKWQLKGAKYVLEHYNFEIIKDEGNILICLVSSPAAPDIEPYKITIDTSGVPTKTSCMCPSSVQGFARRRTGGVCKHIIAVIKKFGRENLLLPLFFKKWQNGKGNL